MCERTKRRTHNVLHALSTRTRLKHTSRDPGTGSLSVQVTCRLHEGDGVCDQSYRFCRQATLSSTSYIYIFTINLSKLDRNIFRVLPVDDKNVSNALLVQDKSSLCCLQGLFLIATACYIGQKMFLWLLDRKYNKSVRGE